MPKEPIFAINATDAVQVMQHSGLADLEVVPLAPGGYAVPCRSRLEIQPGQGFCVPWSMWNTAGAVGKQGWVKQITREEFLALARPEPSAPPLVPEGSSSEAVSSFSAPEPPEAPTPRDMTMGELRAAARTRGIPVPPTTTKTELVKRLRG